MNDNRAVRYEHEIPEILTAMAKVNEAMGAHGLDPMLHHLVQLRASQMNRCGFCVRMHTTEARADGETNERLDRAIVWDSVSDFTDRERAALAWTEALTDLGSRADLGALRARLRAHFSEKEIGLLTSAIAMINLWNRINVSKH